MSINLNNAPLWITAKALEKLKLSARAYHRILKLARTIADLDDSDNINSKYLSEAISYRSLDRLMSN